MHVGLLGAFGDPSACLTGLERTSIVAKESSFFMNFLLRRQSNDVPATTFTVDPANTFIL